MAEPETVGKQAEDGVTDSQGVARKMSKGRSGAFAEEIKPTAFERFIVERTCCACCTFLSIALFGLVLCGGMFASGILEIVSRPNFSVRVDKIIQQYNAFVEAYDDHDRNAGQEYSERTEEFDVVTITYRDPEGGNVLKPENFEKMRQVESVLTSGSKWPDWCRVLTNAKTNQAQCAGGSSLLEFWLPSADGTAEQFAAGYGPCGGEDVADVTTCSTNPDFTLGQIPCTSPVFNPLEYSPPPIPAANTMQLLQCMCCAAHPESPVCPTLTCTGSTAMLCGIQVNDHWRRAALYHFGERMDCSAPDIDRARSKYPIGYPLAGWTRTDDDDANDDMFDKIEEDYITDLLEDLLDVREDVKSDNFDVWFVGAGLEGLQQLAVVTRSQVFATGSVLAVFFWLFASIGSLFLACCGILEVIFAIPIAAVLWGIFGMQTVTSFMLSIVFLILGIGADDIFVLWDAFQQANAFFKDRPEHENIPLNRFAYALRRARCAMAVTTFTTIFSLVAAGVSRIPAISGFGIFGAMVVFFDYLLCITFFASCLMLWDRHLKDSWGPIRICQICCSCCRRREDPTELRALEKFFKNRWAPFITRFHKIFVLVWLTVGVAGIITCAAVLRPADEEPTFLRDDYGRRLLKIRTDGFRTTSEDGRITVHVVAGMDGDKLIDRSGTNYQDAEDVGDPIFSQGSADILESPAGQLAMYNLCEAARGFHRVFREPASGCQTYIDPASKIRLEPAACQTGTICFIDWVKDLRIELLGKTEANWHEESLAATWKEWFIPGGTSCADLPYPDCCNTLGRYVCMMQVARSSAGLPDALWLTDRSWAYLEGDRLKWAFTTFNTTLPLKVLPLDEVEPYYDDYEDFVNQNKGILDVYQTSGYWGWMVSQREILQSAFSSVGATMGLALVVLMLATTNWIVALLSFLCIAMIVLCFLFSICIFGWQLGIFEVVGLCVVVGLSVDYSVHIGHAYNEARACSTRAEKTRQALTEMGVSILSGAGTTFVASLFLLPSTFSFYFYFGIFMLITVIISTLVSLTFFPALLALCGPEGAQGEMQWLRRCIARCLSCCGLCCGNQNGKKTSAEEAAKPSSA